MTSLEFLQLLTKKKLPNNQAKILLYISEHQGCLQKHITIDLGMNKNVVCMAIGLMQAKGFLKQEGPYVSKEHYLTDDGQTLADELTWK